MAGYRHIVNVMRPSQAQGTVGEEQGQDTVWRRDVPCSIETLTAREAEQVHSTWPSVTKKIEMYADPTRQVTPNMYLSGGTLGKRLMSDGTTADRILNIVGLEEDERNLKVTLFCEEAM